jgi:RNA polymerase sigma-70 factor (ECF subfamily)
MKYEYEKLTDEELFSLLSKSKEVSEKAFNEIYKRYSGKIYSYLYRLLGDKFFIKDIFQEVFTKVYKIGIESKNRHLFSFRSYIYQATRNICLNHYKNEGRLPEIHTEYMKLRTEDNTNISDTLDLVKAAVDKLPDNLREVFILSEFEELNYPAIAEITGDSQVNIRVKIHRARKMLKDIVLSLRNESKKMVENE